MDSTGTLVFLGSAVTEHREPNTLKGPRDSLRCFLCLTFVAGLWNLLMGVLCLLQLGDRWYGLKSRFVCFDWRWIFMEHKTSGDDGSSWKFSLRCEVYVSPKYESSRLLIFHQCHDEQLFMLLPFFGGRRKPSTPPGDGGSLHILWLPSPFWGERCGVGTSYCHLSNKIRPYWVIMNHHCH